MQTVLIVALVMSVVLLSYHFEPVPATHEIGVPTWEQTRHVPASGIPLEEICDCITRTVSENVYFGPVGIPDNASGQPVGIFADRFLRGVVTSITASIDISHPSQGDLKIVMTAPDGTEAILHNRQGGQTTYVPKEYDSATSHALASLTGLESDGRWWLTVSDYSEGRTGSADKITITITSIPLKPEPGPVRTLSSSEGSPDSPIPDDTDGQDMSYVLDISDGGTVSDVYVLANITHAYRGDLKVILTAPDGTESVLHGRSGGGQNNVASLYGSENNSDLAQLIGMDVAGEWTISVGDYRAGDTGVLNQWGMTLEYDAPV